MFEINVLAGSKNLLPSQVGSKTNILGSKSYNILQSTLVISKSKGPSKILRDIRTSTYQTCSIEEKTI